jgi:SAM-dependent methyltransferase
MDHSVWATVHQQRRHAVLGRIDDLDLPRGARVLDLGCGSGTTSIALAQRGFSVAATDRTPAMLELARQQAHAASRTDTVQFSVGDAHAIGFQAQTFDLVLSLGVIPWLHSPGVAVCEMSRVLRAGGHLIVNADNRARLTYALDPRRNMQLAPLRMMIRSCLGRPPREGARATLHGIAEFDRLLRSAGLEKLNGTTFGFGPFTLFGWEVMPTRVGRWLNAALQGAAERGLMGLQAVGSQYLVTARKPFAVRD